MARSRNNGVADFLSTFNQTYGLSRRVAADRAMKQALEAEPTTVEQYTPEQAAQIQDMGQRDEFMGFEPGRGYTSQVIPEGQTGPMAPIAPEKSTSFLGKTVKGEMTPQQITTARYNAAADSMAKFDPERALQLRGRALELEQSGERFAMDKARSQREETRFGWETQRAAREERTAQRKDDSDELLRNAMASYTGEESQIGATAKYLNTNSKRITMGSPDKDGLVQLSVVTPDGRAEFMNLPQAQQAQLFAGAQLMGTDPERALQLIGGVNTSLAKAVADENNLTYKVADNGNSVADKRAGRDIQRQGLALQGAGRAEQERHNRAMEGIAGQRAAAAGGAGGKGSGAMWDQAVKIAEQGHFGGSPEKAYEGLKRGSVRDQVKDNAGKLELELRKAGQPEDIVQQQLGGYLRGQGLASPRAVAMLRAGVKPDGKPLTAEDYAAWDATYPNMTVEDVLGEVPQPKAAPAPAPRGLPPRMNQPAPAAPAAQDTGRTVNGLPASMLDYSRLNQPR